jgi:hypothetical protein
MISDGDERRVEKLFALLREQESCSAPTFEETLERHHRFAGWLVNLPPGAKVGMAALLLVVLLSPVLLFWNPESEADLSALEPGTLEIVQWNSPTDFLMETDDSFLSEVPEIGVGSDWMSTGDDHFDQ